MSSAPTTFTVSAPGAAPNWTFGDRLGTQWTANKYGQISGVTLGALRDLTGAGCQMVAGEGAASLTAGTVQTLVGSTALLIGVNTVNAANANDGVALPDGAAGDGKMVVVITVGSTATPKVWPQTADAIDAGSAAAAVTLTAAHRGAFFFNSAANKWVSTLFGAVAS